MTKLDKQQIAALAEGMSRRTDMAIAIADALERNPGAVPCFDDTPDGVELRMRVKGELIRRRLAPLKG